MLSCTFTLKVASIAIYEEFCRFWWRRARPRYLCIYIACRHLGVLGLVDHLTDVVTFVLQKSQTF